MSSRLFYLNILVIILFSCKNVNKSTVYIAKKNNVQNTSLKYDGMTKKKWLKQKKYIRKNMQLVMGALPSMNNLPEFNVRKLDSTKYDNYSKYNIVFTVAENEDLPALLYIPNSMHKSPAMLALHGTSALGKKSIAGTSPKPNRAYAVELASRGYVVIAPDYPGFGDLKDYSFDNDRYTSGTMKGIFNHIRCIDFLQSLPNVDAEKIGVIGHSLGAHNAIFVSAFDERIKITIASSGWTLFPYYDAGEKATTLYGGKLGPWTQKLYMPTIKSVYELDATKIPFDFDDVIATIAPRIFYNNSPLNDANFDVGGVKAGINNVKKIYRLFNAENNIYTRYPDDVHNFPPAIRKEAYQKIDSVFHFKSLTDTLFF